MTLFDLRIVSPGVTGPGDFSLGASAQTDDLTHVTRPCPAAKTLALMFGESGAAS